MKGLLLVLSAISISATAFAEDTYIEVRCSSSEHIARDLSEKNSPNLWTLDHKNGTIPGYNSAQGLTIYSHYKTNFLTSNVEKTLSGTEWAIFHPDAPPFSSDLPQIQKWNDIKKSYDKDNNTVYSAPGLKVTINRNDFHKVVDFEGKRYFFSDYSGLGGSGYTYCEFP
jgi:hypothetical protein